MQTRWLVASLLLTALASGCKSTHSETSAEVRDYMNLQLWVDWYLPGGDYTGLIDLKGSPGFDPQRKTIIHFSGWSIGRGEKGRYFKTNYAKDGSPDLVITDVWLNKGWNFAVVDWTQFSDEIDLRNAEAKIWTTAGPSKNRWMNADGKWIDGPDRTVSQMLADRLEPQLAALKNEEVIFMGHSFGSQVAVAVAAELHSRLAQNPAIKMPKEIVMSDPVFTSGKKSYLNQQTPLEYAAPKIEELVKSGLAFSLYRCAAIRYQSFFVDDSFRLANSGVLTIETDYKDIPVLALDKRHKACKWKYLMSIEQNSALVDGKDQAVGIAIQDRSIVRELARQKQRLILIDQINERPSYKTGSAQ